MVEHLDLSLRLTPALEKPMSDWLKVFHDQFDYPVMQPKIKGDHLMINSQDLIELIGYCDPQEVHELEWKRLEVEATEQLERLLQKAADPELRYHYQWCLTGLKSLKPGRRREPHTDI